MHEVIILKCSFCAKKGLFGALASIPNPMKQGTCTYSRKCKQGTSTRVCISEYAIREYPGYVKAFCGSTPPPKTFQIIALFLSLLLLSFRSRSLPLPSSFLLPLSLFLSSSSLLLAPALFLYSSRSRSLPLFLLSEYSSRSSSVPLFLKLPLCSSLPLAPALFLCPLAPTLFLCSSRSRSLPLFLLPLTLSESRSLPLDPNVSPWILTSLPGST